MGEHGLCLDIIVHLQLIWWDEKYPLLSLLPQYELLRTAADVEEEFESLRNRARRIIDECHWNNPTERRNQSKGDTITRRHLNWVFR